jgi:hypothetical protein
LKGAEVSNRFTSDILHRDRSRSAKPDDEHSNTRKSRLGGHGGADSPPRDNYIQQKLNSLKDYQQRFPKNDLADSNYRPILIGKSSLNAKQRIPNREA